MSQFKKCIHKFILNNCIQVSKELKIIITHSQREAYMVLVRNGGSGSGGSGSGGSGGGGSGRQLSQNPQAI